MNVTSWPADVIQHHILRTQCLKIVMTWSLFYKHCNSSSSFQIIPRLVKRTAQKSDIIWFWNRLVKIDRVFVRGSDNREHNHPYLKAHVNIQLKNISLLII